MLGGDTTVRARLGPPQSSVRVPLRRPCAASTAVPATTSPTAAHPTSPTAAHPTSPTAGSTSPPPTQGAPPLWRPVAGTQPAPLRRPAAAAQTPLSESVPLRRPGVGTLPAPLRRPAAVPGSTGQEPVLLRMPGSGGAGEPVLARVPGSGGAGEPVLARVPGLPPASASRLNPFSAPFVPQTEVDAAGPEPELELPQPQPNQALLTEIADPADAFQAMVYNNIALTVNNITCCPASYSRLADNLVDNLNGWLPSSGIPLSTVLDWLFSQVAWAPAFRYPCARLCQLLCTRCTVTQQGSTFRHLLLTRCQQLYGQSDQLLLEDVVGYSELTLLFCELYLHVLLAPPPSGGAVSPSPTQQQPISVLGAAVLGLCTRLMDAIVDATDDDSDDVTRLQQLVTAVCRALKLAGGTLDSYCPAELELLMERVRSAALSVRLPRDACHALLELVTLRASRWGGQTEPSSAPEQPSPAAAATAAATASAVQVETGPLTDEEERFLQRQISFAEDEDEEEADYEDAYDAFLEQLDREL